MIEDSEQITFGKLYEDNGHDFEVTAVYTQPVYIPYSNDQLCNFRMLNLDSEGFDSEGIYPDGVIAPRQKRSKSYS